MPSAKEWAALMASSASCNAAKSRSRFAFEESNDWLPAACRLFALTLAAIAASNPFTAGLLFKVYYWTVLYLLHMLTPSIGSGLAVPSFLSI